MIEIERIKEAYEKRDLSGRSKLYSLFKPASLFTTHQREKEILKALSRFGISDLADKKILDFGCGTGGVLRDFIKYGAMPENCFGIDLLPDRIDTANKLSPNIDVRCGNGEKLPYEDALFNMVLCFTVFTSIFDEDMKRQIAEEMLRVLKPEGIILWFDYHMNNPQNPDVRGVKKKEIHGLFPNCEIHLKRITLAPPLARAIAPRSWLACYLLEKLKVFNTHYVGIIKKIPNPSTP